MKLEAGAVIADRFRLERPLGRGGMGVVWVAHDLRLDSPCAVKFLLATIDDRARQRFALEAKAAAQLRSPNVVQVLDHGEAEGVPYIAMELLVGEDLASRLAREGRLSLAKTAEIVEHIARALSRAHAAGLVHRDLKPANVFLAKDDDREVVKVLDFGIAKTYADPDAPPASSRAAASDADVSITATGTSMGTPSYMSPEQISGLDVDARADVWALGVLAFQCLTGRLPFEAENLGKLYTMVLSGSAPSVSTVAPALPAALDAWFAKALAKSREDRFATARELWEALERVLPASVRVASERGIDPDGPTVGVATAPMMFAATEVQQITLGAPAKPARRWILPVLALGFAAVAGAVLVLRSSSAANEPGSSQPPAPSTERSAPVVDVQPSATASASVLPPFDPRSSAVVELAAGLSHTCARLASGQVACWGRGYEGQLGAVIMANSAPVMMPSMTDAARVYAAGTSTCVVRSSGAVVCHGTNASYLESSPALKSDVVSLGLSPYRGLCAVKTSGQVLCALGIAAKVDASGAVSGLEDATQVAVGDRHVCALRRSGKVSCWGSNRQFQLAGPAAEAIEEPRDVPGASDLVELEAGATHTCGRRKDGAVLCWGDPNDGKLGAKDLRRVTANLGGGLTTVEGPKTTKAEPVLEIDGAKDLGVGSRATCTVTGGDVRCWGSNQTGELGRGSFGVKPFPVGSTPPPPETILSGATHVAVGAAHACALLSSGEVHCWGRNDELQLGTASTGYCERSVACSTRPIRVLP